MVVFNYTGIKRREKRIYSFFNTNISKTGIVANTVITSATLVGIFGIFGLLFCWLTGTFWYNPLTLATTSKAGYFYLVFVFTPISIGIFVNSVKFQNYKLIDFLKIYFTPKIALNQDGKKVKIDKYSVEAYIERI